MPVEGRWLYASILLIADDVGLFECTDFKLARAAAIDINHVQPLMQIIVDRDLVRLYHAGDRALGFVPRFRQRLQIKRSKYPLPPESLLVGDEDAIRKINNLRSNPRLDSGEPPGSTDTQRLEPNLTEPISISSSSTKKTRRQKADVPPCPHDNIIELYHAKLPELPKVKVDTPRRQTKRRAFWAWVLTSIKTDGTRRATDVHSGLAWLTDYFDHARKNDFLMGRGQRSEGHESWRCDLDFLMTERGLLHVVEKSGVGA